MLEGMLDNLSQPVAFASAPLVPPEVTAETGAAHAREGGSEDEQREGKGLVQRAGDLFGSAIHAAKPSTSSPIDRTQVLPPAEVEDLEELPSDWGEPIFRFYLSLSNTMQRTTWGTLSSSFPL